MRRIVCGSAPQLLLTAILALLPFAEGWSGDVFADLTEKQYMESDGVFLTHLASLSKEDQQALVAEMITASLASLKPTAQAAAAESAAGTAAGTTAAVAAAPEPRYYIDPHSGRRFIYDETLKDWRIDETYTQTPVPTTPAYAPQQQPQPQYYQQQQSPAAGFREAIQTMGAAASIFNAFRR